MRVNEHVGTVKEVPGRFPFLDDDTGVDPAGMLGERGDAAEREERQDADHPPAEPRALPDLELEDEHKRDDKAKSAKVVFSEGQEVMTTAGPAIIDKVLPKGDVRVRWPGGPGTTLRRSTRSQ